MYATKWHISFWRKAATTTITIVIHKINKNPFRLWVGGIFLPNDYLKWLECFYWHFIGEFRQSFVHCFGVFAGLIRNGKTVYVWCVTYIQQTHQHSNSEYFYIFISNLIIDKHFSVHGEREDEREFGVYFANWVWVRGWACVNCESTNIGCVCGKPFTLPVKHSNVKIWYEDTSGVCLCVGVCSTCVCENVQ